jgi:hypothetical protein
VLQSDDSEGNMCCESVLYLITVLTLSSMQVVRRLQEHGWPDDLKNAEYVQAVQRERAEHIGALVYRHHND